METKRAQTLEALETFIQTQRALLERTQTDITRLQQLRSDVVAQPASFVSNMSDQLNANSFRLSDQVDCQCPLPPNVDWGLYKGRDPGSLQALAHTTQKTYIQRSPLSDLQKFVKEARRTIVDPVSSHFDILLESDPDDTETQSDLGFSRSEISAEELKREKEREKLRELKKRKILGCGGLALPSADQRRRPRGPSGVFVRRDVEDENEEVDVDLSLDLDLDNSSGQGVSLSSTPMEVDMPLPPSRPGTLSEAVPSPLCHTPRVRRPSAKLQASVRGASTAKSKTAGLMPRNIKRKRDPVTEPETDPATMPATGNRIHPDKDRASGKLKSDKSETYKQAWSVSEQHLLEQLLEQIPDGTTNRWQKISRAMDGKRTPRQVASRVQKYFEKLKRFGLETASGTLEGHVS
ncbi:hypothetical protein L208DRAFT_94885 [Tricholoma matsutake]|nr:hypothetical protein L208DRAFT_94885 [Tricholoma matsutake 945]